MFENGELTQGEYDTLVSEREIEIAELNRMNDNQIEVVLRELTE